VDEPVAIGLGSGHRGQEPRGAVEQIRSRVCLDREPRGRRPDGRRRTPGKRSDQSLVEPTSVTVQFSGARASTSSTSSGRTVTGGATTARSAWARTALALRFVDRAALVRSRRRRVVGVVAADPVDARAAWPPGDGRAHQARAHEREAHC